MKIYNIIRFIGLMFLNIYFTVWIVFVLGMAHAGNTVSNAIVPILLYIMSISILFITNRRMRFLISILLIIIGVYMYSVTSFFMFVIYSVIGILDILFYKTSLFKIDT